MAYPYPMPSPMAMALAFPDHAPSYHAPPPKYEPPIHVPVHKGYEEVLGRVKMQVGVLGSYLMQPGSLSADAMRATVHSRNPNRHEYVTFDVVESVENFARNGGCKLGGCWRMQSRKFPEPKFSNEGLATPIYLGDILAASSAFMAELGPAVGRYFSWRPSS